MIATGLCSRHRENSVLWSTVDSTGLWPAARAILGALKCLQNGFRGALGGVLLESPTRLASSSRAPFRQHTSYIPAAHELHGADNTLLGERHITLYSGSRTLVRGFGTRDYEGTRRRRPSSLTRSEVRVAGRRPVRGLQGTVRAPGRAADGPLEHA